MWRCLFVAAALAGCDLVFSRPLGIEVPVEASVIDVPADTIAMGDWGSPQLLDANLPTNTDDPSLTGDLLEIYFNVGNDVHVATRDSVGESFKPSAPVPALSGGSRYTTPRVFADGLAMYVARDGDMYFTKRSDRGAVWDAPQLVPELSELPLVSSATMSSDGRVIALTSSGDLFLATRDDSTAPWNPPQPITELNTGSSDEGTMLSADGLTLYFYSDRTTRDHLYVAKRANRMDAFTMATMIAELASNQADKDLWVSPDEHHLVFVRTIDSMTRYLFYATR